MLNYIYKWPSPIGLRVNAFNWTLSVKNSPIVMFGKFFTTNDFSLSLNSFKFDYCYLFLVYKWVIRFNFFLFILFFVKKIQFLISYMYYRDLLHKPPTPHNNKLTEFDLIYYPCILHINYESLLINQ